jgi:hypothetical protein
LGNSNPKKDSVGLWGASYYRALNSWDRLCLTG